MASGVMHAGLGVTHERMVMSHAAIGALQFEIGVMHEAAQVAYVATVVTPVGSVVSCSTMPETQIPAVGIAGCPRGVHAGLGVGRELLAVLLLPPPVVLLGLVVSHRVHNHNTKTPGLGRATLPVTFFPLVLSKHSWGSPKGGISSSDQEDRACSGPFLSSARSLWPPWV